MGYRDLVLAANPSSYWRLGERAGAPVGAGVDPVAGLIYGDVRGEATPLRGDWQNWSWGVPVGDAIDLRANATASGVNQAAANPYEVTIGPYGLKWPRSAGDGAAALYLHSDAGIDWTQFTHMTFWLKMPAGAAAAFRIYWQRGYVTVGSPVDINGAAVGGVTFDIPGTTDRMREFTVKLTGTAEAGVAGSFGLSGGNLNDLIFVNLGATPVNTTYVDEIHLVKTRAAFNSLGVPASSREIRNRNWVANHLELLQKPANPYSGNMRGYYDALDGNASGDTEQILRWATRKWGFADIAPAYVFPGSGGQAANMPELGMAICQKESNWWQWMHSDWEPWNWGQSGDPDLSSWTFNSWGIGQNKSPKFWHPYPHTRMSTAWGAEVHMSVVRAHFDGAIYTATEQYPINPSVDLTTRLRRAVNAWYTGHGWAADGVSDGAFSEYVCTVLGGRVRENGSFYDGVTLTGFAGGREWTTVAIDADMSWSAY